MRFFFLFTLVVFNCSVQAELEWRESNLWQSAQVLSQGQHRWAARVGQKSVDKKFNSQGTSEDLGASYQKEWAWKEVLSAEKNLDNQVALSEYMETNGISPDDIAATSEIEVKREEVLLDFSWAYGVTKRWMFGFFMPISHVTTNSRPNIHVNPQAVTAVQRTQKAPSMSNNEASKVVEGLVEAQVANQGFRSISEETKQWVWGDLSLLNQFLVYEGEDQKVSFQQVLKIPTSRNPSLSDYIQTSRDDGQIDLGISGYYDYYYRAATMTASVGYLNQLPGTVKSTRFDENNQRVNDIDVRRDLGDLLWAGADLKWSFNSKWAVSGGYRYFDKGKDKFDSELGSSASNAQSLQVLRFVTNYVFTPVEERYHIEKKWAVNMQVQSALAGREADQATTATLELQTYF